MKLLTSLPGGVRISRTSEVPEVTSLSKEADLQTQLQPHQQRVVERMKTQPGLVVAHGLGSGKTLTSIAAQEQLGMPADVVVPAALRANYNKEVEKHTAGRTPARHLKSIQNVALRGGQGLQSPMLIVDEAHRARDPGGRSMKALQESEAQKRMLLTASPFYNHPADIAPLVNLAAGQDVLPGQRGAFEKEYITQQRVKPGFFARLRGVQPGEVPVINQARRPELQKTLNKWVDYHMDSNSADFPEVERQDVRVNMTPQQLQMYDAMLKKAPFWVAHKIRAGLPPSKQEAKELNAFMSAVRQVSNTTAPFQREGEAEIQDPKIQAAFEHLQQNLAQNPRAKAVVYSNFLQAGLDPYKQRLQQAGIPFGEFTGEMPKTVRDKLVQDYNANKIRALLLSSAGGEGLDLKGTRLIQVLDPHWNNEKIKQVEGRGVRYKSHADLPEAERKVLIERYLATRPRSGIAEKLHLSKPGGAADEYLATLSKQKEDLINQFKQLMAEKQEPAKTAEFAPGIPEKGKQTPIPEIKKPETWEFSAHPHHAERAGVHIDMRLGNPKSGVAHSFVVPRAKFPKPGESIRIIPTHDHTVKYMDFTGTIQEGYGKGEVLRGRREKAEVYHGEPSDEPGTKIRFNLYGSTQPEEFSIRKDDKGRWFLHNKTQTRLGRPDIPAEKPSYKETDYEKVDPADVRQLVMPKYDGAHTIVDLQAGRSPRVFSYRTAKVSETGLIEHTHKIPKLLETKVPKALDGTLLRAETIAVGKDGKAIPAEQIGGLLNSKVWESRKKQEEAGAELKVVPFSVLRFMGKDITSRPIDEKVLALETVTKALPALMMPEIAREKSDKVRLLKAIKEKKHPHTEEGVVLVSTGPDTVTTKAKIVPDHDVYVREIHPAISIETGKPHDRAGAVSYSWTEDGPIVGRFGGFKHDEAKDMLAHPEKYKGRVAKVKAMKVFEGEGGKGALFQPRFSEWHLDKGEVEKKAELRPGDVPKDVDVTREFKDFLAGAKPGDIILTKPSLGHENLLHKAIRGFQKIRGKENASWLHGGLYVGDNKMLHASMSLKDIKSDSITSGDTKVRGHTVTGFGSTGRDMLLIRPQVDKKEREEAVERMRSLKGTPFSRKDLVLTGFLPAKKTPDELKTPPSSVICTGALAYAYPHIEFDPKKTFRHTMPSDILESGKMKVIKAFTPDEVRDAQ